MKLRERDGLRDTVWWGYVLLGWTWIVFVVGIGGVFGIWEWSLRPIRSVGTGKVLSQNCLCFPAFVDWGVDGRL